MKKSFIKKHITKPRLQYGIFYAALALFSIFLIILNNSITFAEPGDKRVGAEYAKAKVTEIISDTRSDDPDIPDIKIGHQTMRVTVTSGKNSGKTLTVVNSVARGETYTPTKVGSVMMLASYDNFSTATVENYSRGYIVYILLFIFAALVVLLGKKTGVKSLAALVFTVVCIIFFFIPIVILGTPVLPAAGLTVIISTAVTFIFVSGFQKKTYIAAAGCVLCTVLAGLLAYVMGQVSNLSSFHTSESGLLIFVSAKTSLRIHDLLFAGILFASMGAIMDTAMSITSSILEMKALNPNLSPSALLKSGMNVGRDVMGTMTNTLILAFAGGSINIFVIYYMYQMPYLQLINTNEILIQLVQGLCGSIGVIASIPICALLASGYINFWKKKKPNRTA